MSDHEKMAQNATRVAIVWGANEFAKNAQTLGQKVFWRMLRDKTMDAYIADGGTERMAVDADPVVLALPGNACVVFRARDIELMRAAVADFDAQTALSKERQRT